MKKIGFIGAGNMGGALIIAACRTIGADKVLITDYDRNKAQALAEETGCTAVSGNVEVAKNAEYIVLAVKPNIIRSVASELAAVLQEDKDNGCRHVVVTIAAGISTQTIRECIGEGIPVIRIMPNTTVQVGQGMILMADSGEAPEAMTEFQEIMKGAGSFMSIPESSFDITTSISSCSPAYVYMFISAMADGAVQMGVPRAQAIHLAAQTVLGSARMVLETGIHPDQLKDNVCSPGGSTIVGVTALEQNNFRYAAAQAIIQSTMKNLDLGK